MRKQKFTLVEMLLVIALIAMLAGLLLGAIGGMKEKAKVTKATAEIHALMTAIKSYESTYGVLPLVDAATSSNGVKDPVASSSYDLRIGGTPESDTSSTESQNYDHLIQWLSQVRTSTGGAVDQAGNVRKIKFLDPPSPDGSKTFLDPWENRYIIIMDSNYNGQVSVSGSSTKPYDATNDLYGSVFVYSKGPNAYRKAATVGDDKGLRNGVNANGKEYDDIGSWFK